MQAIFTKKNIYGIIFPLLAAGIWGVSFPAQAVCIKYMNAFWINAIRSLLAALVLAIVVVISQMFSKREMGESLEEKHIDKGKKHAKKLRKREVGKIGKTRDVILGSIICGVFLFAAVNLQQIGIADTDSGKAGFITALYTVLVPLIGVFLGQRIGLKTWVAVAVSVVGLFLLCIKNDFTIATSDIIIMFCALCFALQMTFLDRYINKVNPIALSCGQFFVVGILSLIVALFTEDFASQDIMGCLPSLLYIALFSSGIAYTLQVASYKAGNPAVLALLFSLESVFAVIAGAILLGERLSGRELIGCVVMFTAVTIAELPSKKKHKRVKAKKKKSQDKHI